MKPGAGKRSAVQVGKKGGNPRENWRVVKIWRGFIKKKWRFCVGAANKAQPDDEM